MRTRPVLFASALAAVLVSAVVLCAAESKAPDRISLMQTFADWKYPGASFGGASMSDGGIPGMQSVKCQAKQTTLDAFDKVVDFYAQKLGPPKNEDAKNPAPGSEDKSVGAMADSEGRPVSVHVFAVNKALSATTLVVSRAKDESQTHIDWLHFIKVESKR